MFKTHPRRKLSAEVAIAIVVVLSYTLTATVTLGPRVLGRPLTKEEVIEISRNRDTVKKAFTYHRGYSVSLSIEHWNSTYINAVKEEYGFEFLPDDRGVWKLLWIIDFSIYISQWIDDLTGQVIEESALNG